MGTGRPYEGFRVTYGGTSNRSTEFVRIVPVYQIGQTTASEYFFVCEMSEDRKDKNQ